MRKLGFALALAAAALFAQGARAVDTADTADKAKQAGKDAAGEVRKGGQRASEAGDRAINGSGSTGSAEQKTGQKAEEARSPMNGDTQNRTAQNTPEKKHPLFDGKKNFDVDGKIQKVSAKSITIQRDELPPATLSLSRDTKIELDGDQASAQQLKPGEDVKASFNLNKDKAEAVEIKAKRSDGK